MKKFVNIDVKSNESKKTFTIRKTQTQGSKTKTIGKYRTNKLPRREFEEMQYWEQLDWQSYLNRTCDYYIVK